MSKFFKAVFGLLKRWFSGETSAQIGKLVEAALPIVELIAQMTPTRADDEIVAMLRALEQEDIWNPALKREEVLRRAAVNVLIKRLPGTAGRLANLAVELAYNAWVERHQ